MPVSQRKITPADILPPGRYERDRAARRAALLPIKQLRRVEVGPYCTFYFESFTTMLFQVEEMLHVEGGGPSQLADELAAYNPLIPRGDELVATIMFEIDEPARRERALASLGGVEDRFFIQVGAARIAGLQENDLERTRDDGKASSVHFAHFRFTLDQIAAFADFRVPVLVGVNHPEYAHLAQLSPATRSELIKDFAAA